MVIDDMKLWMMAEGIIEVHGAAPHDGKYCADPMSCQKRGDIIRDLYLHGFITYSEA